MGSLGKKGDDWPTKTAEKSTMSANTPMTTEKYAKGLFKNL